MNDLRPYPECTPGVRHFFAPGTSLCTCETLERPVVDVAEATLFQPSRTLGPPASGDEQRRCWTLYMHPAGNGQCRLYNGHAGDHEFGLRAWVGSAAQGLVEYALVVALIAIVAIITLLFLGDQVSAILSAVGSWL
jgi:Flp pilus assembly pilin Flp